MTLATSELGGISPTGWLTLSFDHDIVDGALAARFARELVELIEMATILEEAVQNGAHLGSWVR